METKVYEIPSFRYDPKLFGVGDESMMIPGSEIVVKEPLNPNPDQAILLIPGFGHTIGNIGASFHKLSENLCTKLSMTTAIAVPDTRDEAELSHMNVIQGAVHITVSDALQLLNKPAHLIGFSRHCLPTIETALQIAEWDKENLRSSNPVGQILSVTLCGPAMWEDIAKIMKEKGAYQTSSDENGKVVLLGRRQIRVSPIMDLPEFSRSSPDQQGVTANITPKLKGLEIPVRILASEGDGVVKTSYSDAFAAAVGGTLEVIKPASMENNLHDFDDEYLFDELIKTIKTAKIASPRQFTPQFQAKDRLPMPK